jgi:hypothetical protein
MEGSKDSFQPNASCAEISGNQMSQESLIANAFYSDSCKLHMFAIFGSHNVCVLRAAARLPRLQQVFLASLQNLNTNHAAMISSVLDCMGPCRL